MGTDGTTRDLNMTTHEYILRYYPEYHDIRRYPVARTVRIGKVADEWGILGNMAKCLLTVDGVTFPSSEHIYQIMRFSDTELRKILLRDPSTYSMKRFKAKKHFNETRPDWHSHLVDIMRFVLSVKYEQCEAFRNELHRTGDLFIIEDETRRMKGKAADSFGAVLSFDGLEYIGPNLLGRLLMELRDAQVLKYSLPESLMDFSDLR